MTPDDLTERDRRIIAAMMQIIVNAIDKAAQRYGVPSETVARQMAAELGKLANDRKRLDAACDEIDRKRSD